jgi:hypothetical protein
MSRTVFRRMCFLLTISTSAFATTFMPLPLSKQTVDAPNIVRGIVGTSYSDWGMRIDGTKDLFTFYQLQPTEVFKGDVDPSKSFIFRELGGEKDGVGMQVPGSGQFSVGEDVIILLGPVNPDGSYDLRGLSSGKYNITRQEDGTETLSGVGLAPPGKDNDKDGFVHDDETSPLKSDMRKWTISDLRRIVHEQGAAPKTPTKSALPTSIAKTSSSSLAAPRLQPSASPVASDPGEEGAPEGRGRYWILAAVLMLAGLFACLRAFRKK